MTLYLLTILIPAIIVFFLILKQRERHSIKKQNKTKEEYLNYNQAKKEAEELLKTARNDFEKKIKELNEQFKIKNERFSKNEEIINNREEKIVKKEKLLKIEKLKLVSLEEEIQSKQELIKRTDKELTENLYGVAKTNFEIVKQEIINQNLKELYEENERKSSLEDEILKEELQKKAKRIVNDVTQRLSFATSVESRAVYLKVPEDKIKGKIVGKDGQNIIFFESILNEVEILFNDLPNTITISCFNLVKRRIAQKSMEELIRFRGEINPEVIKNTIENAEKQIDRELMEIGFKAAKKMAIGKEDPELLGIIGRLYFRTSYGQNIMRHSMEVGWAASMIAGQIGADSKTARISGFLHDLGKAIDQDPNVKDAHDYISKELMEKYGFSWEEVHAAWTHHDAIPMETPEAFIVKAADSISASRPGARQESLGKYIERMKELEATVSKYKGIEKSYAISAGREVRAFVDAKQIRDSDMEPLANKIAEEIEEKIAYPGKIKINLIRKTKYIENIKTRK